MGAESTHTLRNEHRTQQGKPRCGRKNLVLKSKWDAGCSPRHKSEMATKAKETAESRPSTKTDFSIKIHKITLNSWRSPSSLPLLIGN
jgi:hypothetical protein